MEVRNGEKVAVCGDEVGQKNLFAFMGGTWLTGRQRSGRGEEGG